jgi:hypothetical protein
MLILIFALLIYLYFNLLYLLFKSDIFKNVKWIIFKIKEKIQKMQKIKK